MPANVRGGAKAALTAVVGGGAAYGVSVADKKRFTAAPKSLWNSLQGRDPLSVTAEEVNAMGAKFGIANMGQSCATAMTELYDVYLMSLVPQGLDPVQGWEAAALAQFRQTLGIDDASAAQAHLEAGRRLFRKRIELGSTDKETDLESRKEFQKLVFISTQTFGEEQARFLLPWKRVFRVSDAQVDLANRDNASQLLRTSLSKSNAIANVDAAAIASAADYKASLNLDDDAAGEIAQDLATAHVAGIVNGTITLNKERGSARDVGTICKNVEQVLAYNVKLEGAQGSFPGVGPVTLFGGEFDSKMTELKDVFRTYLEEGIKGYSFSAALNDNLGKLRLVFGMGNKEADDIILASTTASYRLALRDAVKSGSLDNAESPAKVLQGLCEGLRFPPEVAAGIHEENYRTKLESIISSNKKLEDADVEALARVRKLLCVPKGVVEKLHFEICGEIYRTAVRSALSVPTESFTPALRDRCKAAKANVRLDDETALKILGAEARKQMSGFIRTSKSIRNKTDAQKEIRKMIFYNQGVVTPLVQDVTKAKAEAAAEELASLLKEAQEAAAKEEAEEKAKAAAEATAAEPEAAAEPTEVTLAEDMDVVTRQAMYREYLMFCMTGDQVNAPMGVRINIERDQSEFKRLSQLGDILGLNMMEVGQVHKDLADKAFRTQAEQMLGDGRGLTADRAEKLKEIQTQLNLPEDEAQKIIKGITSQRMMSNVQQQIASGTLDAAEVRKMIEAGVEIERMIPEDKRMNLFRKNAERRLGDGSGSADIEALTGTLVEDLKIDGEKAKTELKNIAAEKKRSQMIQGVAVLRQKKAADVLLCCRNLVACQAVAPEAKLEWKVESEVFDMYSVFVQECSDVEERKVLQSALSISDESARKLEQVVADGAFKFSEDSLDEALF
ncbi:Tic110 family transporter: chloroplast inner envelope protein Tic110 [Ostreococcus lucimarinus CCE9901]|uniref:Tic110 family transporter: chloroplast inner envelope protein Tic110 n=1 Tax=Ostreococcus lucimarinus (strain CCE9901) TaxID=436017 RepID=A4S0R7_OSTLU|nr:Tic110 family transporter: chloroplast inner envelope protein Tic110 [Ostreococcus lucimarinus CCE9901]ABO97080.1 Tic110 family transporter: chloroplast inner envelope protein Tic110 [Ostreococcus lucimarinus CCE9901]|eukprot:XP_001418787.1 Tic110 family transporter: chloroplast inner envelope protein Tic110 [Ostreococcus lucimarinus CCE9901]